MNWIDYREKLGIGFNDKRKFNYFLVKIFNGLNAMRRNSIGLISKEEYFRFCNETGIGIDTWESYGEEFCLIVDEIHRRSDSIEDFLAYYIAFINCLEKEEYSDITRDKLKDILRISLKEAKIQYEYFEDKDGYFVFPKGVEEFDDNLVSEILCWLTYYPETEKAWSKALRKYSCATAEDASDIADLFRKALETFFQEFFGGGKSLENYKSDYGNYLKQNGVPTEIANNLETTISYYTNFMNNYAKHKDRTSEKLLEYIMYQTGNIIRLIITLGKENQ